jgi:hypothetical protein
MVRSAWPYAMRFISSSPRTAAGGGQDPGLHTLFRTAQRPELVPLVRCAGTVSHCGPTFPSAQSLLVMTAYAVAFGFLAVRYFRWE